MEALIAEAVKAAVASLVKVAVPAAGRAGGVVWAWIKRQLAGRPEGESAIAAVEADCIKDSTVKMLEAALIGALKDKPELVRELEALLAESGWRQIVTQTVTVTGEGNRNVQVAGNGNTVNS